MVESTYSDCDSNVNVEVESNVCFIKWFKEPDHKQPLSPPPVTIHLNLMTPSPQSSPCTEDGLKSEEYLCLVAYIRLSCSAFRHAVVGRIETSKFDEKIITVCEKFKCLHRKLEGTRYYRRRE